MWQALLRDCVLPRPACPSTSRDLPGGRCEMVLHELEHAHAEGRLSRVPDPVVVELVITGIEGLTLRYFAEGRRDELVSRRAALVDLLIRNLL